MYSIVQLSPRIASTKHIDTVDVDNASSLYTVYIIASEQVNKVYRSGEQLMMERIHGLSRKKP